MSDAKTLSELQWAHETLVRLIAIVQKNGLVGDRLSECIVQLTKGAVMLEGMIQERFADARRRRDD